MNYFWQYTKDKWTAVTDGNLSQLQTVAWDSDKGTEKVNFTWMKDSSEINMSYFYILLTFSAFWKTLRCHRWPCDSHQWSRWLGCIGAVHRTSVEVTMVPFLIWVLPPIVSHQFLPCTTRSPFWASPAVLRPASSSCPLPNLGNNYGLVLQFAHNVSVVANMVAIFKVITKKW